RSEAVARRGHAPHPPLSPLPHRARPPRGQPARRPSGQPGAGPGRGRRARGPLTEAAAARASILARMEGACRRAGRDAAAVTLVAVSKTVPVPRVRALLEAGQTVFGENRVQEARAKMEQIGGPARWHLVG